MENGTTTDDAPIRGANTKNPTLAALARIGRIIDDLDEDQRRRALNFIVEEYAAYLNE